MENIREFFKNRRNLVGAIILGIIIISLPLIVTQVQQRQVLKSRADTSTDLYACGGTDEAGNPTQIAIGSAQGSCIKNGQTCTVWSVWKYTDENGQNMCDNSKCDDPCTGGNNPSVVPSSSRAPGAPTLTPNPNALVCKSTFKPSELGINNSSVCDRLHEYVADCSGRCDTKATCPQNTSQPTKIVPETSNWCYEFRNTDSDPNNNNKCLQLRFIGQPGEGCAPGEGSGGPNGCANVDTCTRCVLTTRTDLLPFYASAGWDTSCGNMPAIVADWCRINPNECPGVKAGSCASACGLATAPTTAPTSVPNAPTNQPGVPTNTPVSSTFTAFYRVSTAPFGISNDPEWKVYTDNTGMTESLDFGEKTVGSKLIVYAQFKSTTGQIISVTKEAEYIGPDPEISSIECSYSPTGDGTEVRISGQNFGNQGAKSKITFNNKIAKIVSWGNITNPTDILVPTNIPSTPSTVISPRPSPSLTPSPTPIPSPSPTPVAVNLLNANMQNRTLPDGTATGSSPDHYAINEPWFYNPGTYSLSGNGVCTGIGCVWDIRADEYVNSNGTPTGTPITHPNGSTFTMGSGKMFTVVLQLKSGNTATFSAVRLTSLVANQTFEVLGVNSNSVVVAKINDKLKENVAIPVSLETSNGRKAPKSAQLYCTIEVTTVSFNTIPQCRPPINFSNTNVRVQIYEDVKTPKVKPVYDQKITIAINGEPTWTAPVLEVGKNYILIIRGPQGLGYEKKFTATSGGTVALSDLSLPVGDIAPLANPDNVINSADYSELKREWNAITDITRAGDFNLDNRINSIDYSCMRRNFNDAGAKFLTGQ